jgi:hypothetical protein
MGKDRLNIRKHNICRFSIFAIYMFLKSGHVPYSGNVTRQTNQHPLEEMPYIYTLSYT